MTQKFIFKRPYLWPVGEGGMVVPNRVIAAGRWDSAPIRRLVRQAKEKGWLLDLTYGKACQWVLFLDSGHIVLASQPMPIAADAEGYVEEDDHDSI